MTIRVPLIAILFCVGTAVVFGQERQAATPRLITLREALDLASVNNHRVRLARLSVDEKQRASDVARSGYFPVVRTDSSFMHVTDTQLVELPSGSLGIVGNNPIPPRPLIINQGSLSTTMFGTGISQPLTPLLKVSASNDIAHADVEASLGRARRGGKPTPLCGHSGDSRYLFS